MCQNNKHTDVVQRNPPVYGMSHHFSKWISVWFYNFDCWLEFGKLIFSWFVEEVSCPVLSCLVLGYYTEAAVDFKWCTKNIEESSFGETGQENGNRNVCLAPESAGDMRDSFKSVIYHRTNFIIFLLSLTASIDLFHICPHSHKISLISKYICQDGELTHSEVPLLG